VRRGRGSAPPSLPPLVPFACPLATTVRRPGRGAIAERISMP
jgi:hypothetical protein